MTTATQTYEARKIKETDFNRIILKRGEKVIYNSGSEEIVRKIFCERERLIKFVTVGREGKGISESTYSVNKDGVAEKMGAGIHYNEKTDVYNISDRYFKLNEFLQMWENGQD